MTAAEEQFVDSRRVLRYKKRMWHRAATLLLAVAVVAGSLSGIPRSKACCIVPAEGHDCCRASATLRGLDCCDGARELAPRALTPKVDIHHASMSSAVVLSDIRLAPLQAVAFQADLTRGLAPPGSLTAQHTSLLL